MPIEQFIVFVKYSKFPIQVKEAVIKILEKHIAKQVLSERKLYNIWSVGECPSCHKVVRNSDIYCCKCGQKLKWRE